MKAYLVIDGCMVMAALGFGLLTGQWGFTLAFIGGLLALLPAQWVSSKHLSKSAVKTIKEQTLDSAELHGVTDVMVYAGPRVNDGVFRILGDAIAFGLIDGKLKPYCLLTHETRRILIECIYERERSAISGNLRPLPLNIDKIRVSDGQYVQEAIKFLEDAPIWRDG